MIKEMKENTESKIYSLLQIITEFVKPQSTSTVDSNISKEASPHPQAKKLFLFLSGGYNAETPIIKRQIPPDTLEARKSPMNPQTLPSEPQLTIIQESIDSEYKMVKKKKNKTNSTPIELNIITNNINGLKVQSSPYPLESICRKMYDMNIHFLLLQEINTNMRHPKSKKLLQEVTNKYTNLQQVWSQTKYPTSTSYKPGGVAILIKNPIGRYITTES
jgi:hypothetical protein